MKPHIKKYNVNTPRIIIWGRSSVFTLDKFPILLPYLYLYFITSYLSIKSFFNFDEIKEEAHEKAVKYLPKVTGRDPMVLPIIIDIDSKE